LTYIKTKQEGT